MTIDSTVQKTGFTLAVLIIAAGATWVLTGDPATDTSSMQSLYAISLVGALGGFALVDGELVQAGRSARRWCSPTPRSRASSSVRSARCSSRLRQRRGPAGAVIGTIAAFAGTLAAYKFFNIRVTDKFRRLVVGRDVRLRRPSRCSTSC